MAADPEPTVMTLFGDEVVEEALKRYKRASEWTANFRQRFVNDIKFRHGDADNGYQWPNMIKRSRDVDQKPCLTINMIRQHNLQIVNQAKQNKSAVKIVAMGGGATQESAGIYKALVKHTEYISNAQAAYSTALEFAVDGGLGWWRIVTDYADNSTNDQEIYIRRVPDPLAVFCDPDCVEKDKSDANWLLYFDLIPKNDFDELYPRLKGLIGMAPLGIGSMENDSWGVPDHIRVCEYFRKVQKDDVLVRFVDPQSGERKSILKSQLPKNLVKIVLDDPMTVTRMVKETIVEWKLIAGERVVDETEWMGSYIPFIPVIGEETIIDGQYDCKGHTRNLMDAQRMYNYNSPLSLDTPLPTPWGWTTMGQVQRGDELLDENGKAVTVLGTSPTFFDKSCYRITFSDGSKIIADGDHLWDVEERGKRKATTWSWTDKTVKTRELDPEKHFIHLAKPLALPEDKDFPIHPYLLGAWLGDGNTASPQITSHIDDVEELRNHITGIGHDVGEARLSPENHCGVFTVLGVRDNFIKAGFLNDKYIPIQYLRGSYNQRLALLQGLMDTDGHVTPNHQCVFVNTNMEIVASFIELLRSLSIIPSVQRVFGCARAFPNGKVYNTKDSFRVSFTADPDVQVFRLGRKRAIQEQPRPVHWRRTKRIGIEMVEKVSSVPVRCVGVDSESHLFLAGRGMIPTHNSAQVEFVALQSKTPWIASAKAIEEYESMWNTANLDNHSVLIWNDVDDENPDRDIKPPFRQEPPSAAPAYQAGMETAFNQMMMASGQWQNQMGMMGNERTGEAIKQRQQQSDTSVFHFQDNYEMALRLQGKMLIDLYPKIYDTKRTMMVLADDGSELDLVIDPAAKQAFTIAQNHLGQVLQRVFNPRVGKYDIGAEVGPAYGTRKEESVEAFKLILTQNPGLTGIIGDLLLSSMDFENSQEAARRMKRMVPPIALGQGPSQAEQQLQQQNQALTAALGKSLEAHGKDKLRLTGKAEARDIEAYKAQTDRFDAFKDMAGLDVNEIRKVVEQLVQDSIKNTLSPIVGANRDDVGAQSGSGTPPADPPADAGAAAPAPMPGARKAPDGEWYVLDPTRRGKYLRIAPLAQQRQPPGGASAGQ